MSWAYEGVECYVSKTCPAGYIPLYQATHWRGHCFLTAEETEYRVLRHYEKQGVTCYVAAAPIGEHVPLYRLHKPKSEDYCYCASVDQLNTHVKKGYNVEKAIGYVTMRGDAQHVPLMRMHNPYSKQHWYTPNVRTVDLRAPKVDKYYLQGLLESEFRCKPSISDEKFICPTEQAARAIVDRSQVVEKRYIPEIQDCDDFAHLLKAAFIEDAYDVGAHFEPYRSRPYACGIVWGKVPPQVPGGEWQLHAMNVIVTSEGCTKKPDFKVHLVEPQTGEFTEPSLRRLRGVNYLVV